MYVKEAVSPEESKAVRERVRQAREDRNHFAAIYNNFLELARPWRQRVNDQVTPETPRAGAEQDDIFDTTLQDAADDFASDSNDEFTPMYKPWTKHVPTQDFASEGARRQVQEYTDQRMKRLYDRIRESNFEEAAQEMWIDLAIAPSALEIVFTPAGKPVSVEHVPITELLILPGPKGGVGDRFRERCIPVRYLDVMWPRIDWSEFGPTKAERKKSKHSAIITIGGVRDWSANQETWHWYLIGKNKVLRKKTYRGRGSCPLIVARTNVSAPTAYGVGPAAKALAPARTLNEMAYLMLKREGRLLDPPTIFFDDGLLNPEGGVDNGVWLPASADFKVQELRPEGTARETWFTQEDLRMQVKRALFQDKPYQRGDTPPTAAQWLGEEAMAARRKSFPRARIHDELVLPVLRRFEWIMEKRGEIEEIQIEGQVVNLEPVSPLSKSADIEEAQIALQFLQGVGGVMPDGLQRIDEGKTFGNIKEKMGAGLVEVLSDEEFQEKLQMMAQAQAAPGAPQ